MFLFTSYTTNRNNTMIPIIYNPLPILFTSSTSNITNYFSQHGDQRHNYTYKLRHTYSLFNFQANILLPSYKLHSNHYHHYIKLNRHISTEHTNDFVTGNKQLIKFLSTSCGSRRKDLNNNGY